MGDAGGAGRVIDTRSTSLTLEAARTVLRGSAVGEVVAAVGIETVAAHFQHTPPLAAEIERAIDVVEDALMATRLAHNDRGTLTSNTPLLQSLPGLAGAGSVLSREEVELLFGRLADAASGPSAALGDLPADRETAAALLILRETMHHLGFDHIQSARAG